MLVNNVMSHITFRLSTLETFLGVAKRYQDLGMIYADYQLKQAKKSTKDIHLLDYHPGRVRDNMDFGAILFFPKAVLTKVGGFNEKYDAAYLYDLRLKISEKFKIVHIAAAKNGHAYCVQAPEKGHNVFDYLMQKKEVQSLLHE